MANGENSKYYTWGMLCHLCALVLYIGIPFGNIIGPLVIWLIKKDESPFVDAHGKESLNFQISMTLYGIIAGLLCLIFIGYVLLPILLIANIVLIIMGAVAANRGDMYQYPFCIRLIH